MKARFYLKNVLGIFIFTFFSGIQHMQAQNTGPQWPTLAEQLRDAQAISGSAFETLITDNQDFTQLREDEKTDKRGLPPWLRLYWRKSHPELTYSGDDPTGGYPRVLHEIFEWMQSHQDLKSGPGLGKPIGEEEGGGKGGQLPNSTITNEMRISGAQTTPRSESDIRVNFFDNTKIISASNNISASGQQTVFYSTNSGTSWSQTVLPLTGTDLYHSDPTVDWTADGRAWSSTLGISSGSKLRLRTYYSTDNGATWNVDANPSLTQTSVDKQMVWVDHGASAYAGQQYAIWHNGNPAFMSRRTAGAGGTWLAAPIQVSGAESSGTCIGSDVKTNSYGDVFGFWPTTGNSKIFVVKSTNGGTSFGTPVQIATTYDSYDIGIPSFSSRRALIYVSGGAYRTASKNLVYASWTDLTGVSGCSAPANEPGTSAASTCKTRIWFARSTNGGTSWSAPVMINNQAGLNDQFNQWLTVDETTGMIGVMYYDTYGDATRKKTNVYFQYSGNDGVTWSTAQKVTTGTTDETVAGADSGNQYGDYNGMSSYANTAWPVWTDRRNNGKEEVWTAKIASIILPIKVLQFTAFLQHTNDAVLNWNIAAPEYGTTYELQRSSDAKNFVAINIQTGTSSAVQYNYTDAGLVNGNYYYRLKITGMPGEVSFSNTALVRVGDKSVNVNVFPSLVLRGSGAAVQVSLSNAGVQAYAWVDAQGRVVEQKASLHSTGSFGIALPQHLAAGLYFLRLQTDDGILVSKIMVQ